MASWKEEKKGQIWDRFSGPSPHNRRTTIHWNVVLTIWYEPWDMGSLWKLSEEGGGRGGNGPRTGLANDHVIWGPMIGLKINFIWGTNHNIKHTDVATIWLTQPRELSQWKEKTINVKNITFQRNIIYKKVISRCWFKVLIFHITASLKQEDTWQPIWFQKSFNWIIYLWNKNLLRIIFELRLKFVSNVCLVPYCQFNLGSHHYQDNIQLKCLVKDM